MNSVRSQILHPAFLAKQLHGQPITPEQTSGTDKSGQSLLGALRAKSGSSAAMQPAALNAEALDWEHDQQRQSAQRVKHLLANSKLVAQLMGAALRGPGDETVEQYVQLACDWVSRHERQLSERLSDQGTRLSDYHRFELRRLLVTMLHDAPELMREPLPPAIADVLTSPMAGLTALMLDGDPPGWHSAGDDLDIRFAYGRAVNRVMAVCQQHDFGRDPDNLLADALACIEQAGSSYASRLLDVLQGGQDPVDGNTRKIVSMHAISTTSQLYAATLERVHRESVAMIARYQRAADDGDEERAEQIAQEYQTRNLGYAGVPHHYAAFLELMEQIAWPRTPSSSPKGAPPDGADREAAGQSAEQAIERRKPLFASP